MDETTRRQFLKLAGMLGLSMTAPILITGCASSSSGGAGSDPNFQGSVLIIGAGAAGMSAAHLLAQRGIDFQILEASSTYGGRMKRTSGFADFPIPLGAEWLHVARSELDSIVNDASIQIATQTVAYNPSDPSGHYENGSLVMDTVGSTGDLKFVNSTWFDFFDQYIVPAIRSRMQFDTQIVAVDYQGEKVVVTDSTGRSFEADKVIVTAPLKILQRGDIVFTPSLPTSQQTAIESANVWGGVKVFLEFSESFYPTFLTFADSETQAGQRLYYDATYGQNSISHILGLFAVGEQALQYQIPSDDAVRDYILAELDEIFSGKASANYVKHVRQDWNEEAFVGAAYLADVSPSNVSRTLSNSVNQKVYFAGEAYTQEDDWGGVHNATRSARDVIEEIFGSV